MRAGILIAAALPALALAAWQDAADTPDVHADWRGRLADDGREVRLADVSGLDCAACHRDVTEEWRLSTHATAWQDEHYQQEVRKVRRKVKCWGCHVPPPMFAAGLPPHPDPRAEDRHLGVDCRACHLGADGETILGPFGLETAAHPTAQEPRLGADGGSALCVACHGTSIGPVIGVARDFVDTAQAELDLSCVGCHMPGLRGPIADDPEGEQPYPVRRRRSHRLNTPRDPVFLASAFGLQARREEGRVVLAIENRAGHRVPGTTRRELTFELRLIDRHGDVVAEAEHLIDHRHFLPVEQTLEVVLEEVGVKLELRARHGTEGMRRPQVFLERTFELE